jgi:hypothetical protein
MRGRPGDRKIEWFLRSRSAAGETKRQRRISQAREEAETRLLEGAISNLEADTRKAKLEAEKLAGEIAQQPLQAQQLESQSAREDAETRGTDFSTLRDQALLVVFLLMIILILVLTLVNPPMLKTLGAGGLLVAIFSILGYRSSRS